MYPKKFVMWALMLLFLIATVAGLTAPPEEEAPAAIAAGDQAPPPAFTINDLLARAPH